MSHVYEALRKAEKERLASGRTQPNGRSWTRVQPPTSIEAVEFATTAPAGRADAPAQVVGTGSYGRANDEFQVLASHLQGLSDQHAQIVLITSSSPAEGKSFVSLNLAITLARTGKRVLLVDGDLRTPRLHRAFKLTPLRGLAGFLLDHDPLESCLHETEIAGLTIAPAGRSVASGSEVLASPRMREFIAEVRAAARWDYVLLDSAPVLAASETQILARLVDTLLFVVAANQTSRSAIARSLELLKATPLLGLVFNRFDPPYSHRVDYGYGYGYGYGEQARRGRP
jgi:capsular exopolysaccharide synthesis family protein